MRVSERHWGSESLRNRWNQSQWVLSQSGIWEVLKHLELPNSYYKLGIKGYYSASMDYDILDSIHYHLEFAEGKDGRLHLKDIQFFE